MLFSLRFACCLAPIRVLTAALAVSVAVPIQAGGPLKLASADDALLEDIERAAFRFFEEQAHPITGLVRDRARADGSESVGKASIAASGFSLSAWVIAAERGWVTRAAAVERVRAKLRFLATVAPRRHGFFYHFMEMGTGERAWKCELSSIDSALAFAGMIVAREYFADEEISRLANGMLSEVDWHWFRNGGDQVSLSWHDETGFSRYRWDRYSEHVLMSFLALGVGKDPLPASYWRAWARQPLGRYGDFVYVQEPPLFVHQFPQGYLDLHHLRDAEMDYFQNSRLATLAQRQWSIDLRPEFSYWGENVWGLTASDSATGYKAWGGPPRTMRFNSVDGTIVPCAAAGSLIFAPEQTLAVLRHLKSAFGDRIWQRYGFVDAFHPANGWVNPDVIGIDQGITMVQAENLRSGLIHRLFMQAPEVRLGVAKAGFVTTRRELAAPERTRMLDLARATWVSLEKQSIQTGLRLTALVAATRLGLIEEARASAEAVQLIAGAAPAASGDSGILAAGLITVSQAFPAVRATVEKRLPGVLGNADASEASLGTLARLATFLRIGRGAEPVAKWESLARGTQRRGAVHVLAPGELRGALLPGLWLDERAVLAGTSAAQLAYSILEEKSAARPDAAALALIVDQFPVEALRRGLLPERAAAEGDGEAQAALLVVLVNLLERDAIRVEFARDPLVQAARAAISEFVEGAFAPARTSVFAQRELAGPRVLPAQRAAVAVAASRPAAEWQWHRVAGLEFKDSLADIRPEDAPVALEFAFGWDDEALHFRAKVVDSPPGFALPKERNRMVELFVDPARDGLLWLGAGDYQFGFVRSHHWELKHASDVMEFFHHANGRGKITPTDDGYLVEAAIPWTVLGVTPRAGLQIGVSPAIISEGTKEWEATVKLNWSYVRLDESHTRLGLLTLQ